ncbi:YrhB domain-containing protein [Nonomuraea sp. NPDC047529]|uniref:YrhB domain-containing protein n=1 Tax=Nonomuraea sp. NPDC047529 TaxID=3155623 RepID=UPI0033C63A4B
MLTEPEARRLAEAELARLYEEECAYFDPDDSFVLTTMEECSIGWVYHYQSARYLRTGEFTAALGGNAPILIHRRSGAIVPTGTAYPIEHYIRDHELSGE